MRKLFILTLIATRALLQSNAQSLGSNVTIPPSLAALWKASAPDESARSISKAEYFFDKDPGVGKGANMPLTAVTTDSASVTDAISTTGLGVGFHVLYVRAQDNEGKWSLFNGRPFIISTPSPSVTSVPTAEYFFDKDPGAGKGIALNGTVNGDSLLVTAAISTSSLKAGFHVLYARAKDSNGRWGLFVGRPFIISTPIPAAVAVTAAEYFFDHDPGVGKGIAFTGFTSQGDSLVASSSISTSGLNPGFHVMYVRAKDGTGKWGLFTGRLFIVNPTTPTSVAVTGAEYFFDHDPGIGKGTALSGVSNGDSLEITNSSISVAGLNQGIHALYVRAKDSNGEWGLFRGGIFIISTAGGSPQIVSMEYFFDNANPANGKGTPIAVGAPGDSVTVQTALSSSGLAVGAHTVSVRAEDNTGKWSLLDTKSITVNACVQPLIAPFTSSSPFNTTSASSYSTDTAICASGALTLTAPAGYSSYNWINTTTNLSVGTGQSVSVPPGNYSVVLPATTNCPAETIAIAVSGAPSITVVRGAAGAEETLISSSTNSNQWYFNGVAIPGATNQTYIAQTSGNYTVLVSNSCYPDPGVSSAPVTVSVSAGATICTPPVIAPFTSASTSLETTVCTSAIVNLSAPAGYASYNWINTANNVDTSIGNGLLVSVPVGAYALILPATTTCQAETISVTVSGVPAVTIIPGQGSSSDTLVSSSATGNQWYLNGTAITGATGQTYAAVVSGNYYVESKNSCYPNGASSASTAVSISGVTSVTNAVSSLVSVYPNPTSDYVIISPSATSSGSYTGKLIDSKGQVMTTIQFSADYVLSVGYLASGLYLLEIQNNNSLQQTKIVVQQ